MPRTIMNGDFKGFKISRNVFGSAYTPKIFGTYESEISHIFKKAILDDGVDMFVDVGCAGGYYCEIAHQLRPDIKLIGYDLNIEAVKYCRKILPTGDFFAHRFLYESYRSLDFPILFLFDIEGEEFLFFNEQEYLNKHHEFIIEVHCFEKNKDRYISVRNFDDFEIKEIPYNVCKNSFSRFWLLSIVEFLLRHELRNSGTKYLHIKPKLLCTNQPVDFHSSNTRK